MSQDDTPSKNVSLDNYPTLMAETRAKHFRRGEALIVNDYSVYASGIVRPELDRAVEAGLITYVTADTAPVEDPSAVITSFTVTPTTILINLLEDMKEKPGPKTHELQITVGDEKF